MPDTPARPPQPPTPSASRPRRGRRRQSARAALYMEAWLPSSPLPVPATAGRAKYDHVAAICEHQLVVVPAQRPRRPPTVLDQPLLAHRLDRDPLDGPGLPLGPHLDRNPSRHVQPSQSGAHRNAPFARLRGRRRGLGRPHARLVSIASSQWDGPRKPVTLSPARKMLGTHGTRSRTGSLETGDTVRNGPVSSRLDSTTGAISGKRSLERRLAPRFKAFAIDLHMGSLAKPRFESPLETEMPW